MQCVDTSVPVVVLRPDHHGALCLMRTLGRLGVRVYGVGTDPHSPGMSSRYCRYKFIPDQSRASGPGLVDFLLEVARRIGGRPILTCTNDVSTIFIADNGEELRGSYLFPRMPSKLVRGLSDKRQMYFLAKKLAIPTAQTLFPQSRNGLLDLVAGGSAKYPIMLKGIKGDSLDRRGHPPMVIVRDSRELLDKYDQMEDPTDPNLMLQEYIPGNDDSVWMFNGYFNEQSECLIGFVGRKLRQHPVYTGGTSLGILQQNAVVQNTTVAFMKEIGYRGVLDIGYRYDARDGQYKVLDINPRIGSTFRLFVAANNMDVVRAMYLDLTGQPVPNASALEGRKWVLEDGDVMSFCKYHGDGKLKFWDWIRSFRGVQEGAWFAWDDWIPFGRMLFALTRRIFRAFGHRPKTDR